MHHEHGPPLEDIANLITGYSIIDDIARLLSHLVKEMFKNIPDAYKIDRDESLDAKLRYITKICYPRLSLPEETALGRLRPQRPAREVSLRKLVTAEMLELHNRAHEDVGYLEEIKSSVSVNLEYADRVAYFARAAMARLGRLYQVRHILRDDSIYFTHDNPALLYRVSRFVAHGIWKKEDIEFDHLFPRAFEGRTVEIHLHHIGDDVIRIIGSIYMLEIAEVSHRLMNLVASIVHNISHSLHGVDKSKEVIEFSNVEWDDQFIWFERVPPERLGLAEHVPTGAIGVAEHSSEDEDVIWRDIDFSEYSSEEEERLLDEAMHTLRSAKTAQQEAIDITAESSDEEVGEDPRTPQVSRTVRREPAETEVVDITSDVSEEEEEEAHTPPAPLLPGLDQTPPLLVKATDPSPELRAAMAHPDSLDAYARDVRAAAKRILRYMPPYFKPGDFAAPEVDFIKPRLERGGYKLGDMRAGPTFMVTVPMEKHTSAAARDLLVQAFGVIHEYKGLRGNPLLPVAIHHDPLRNQFHVDVMAKPRGPARAVY